MRLFTAKNIIIVILLCLFNINSYGDNLNPTDSLPQDSVKVHSPKRAAWLSAVLPGAGQIYNYKYETKKWFTYAKLTAIWGGGAALVYFLRFNHNEYLRYKNAYIFRLDDNPLTIDEFSADPRYTSEVLKNERDSWRKYRDYCGLGIIGLYFLNIVEASVTAHFWDYDISEDLSFSIRPNFALPTVKGENLLGLSFTFNFK